MMKPGSHVIRLHWLQILLAVLLAGQASCDITSADPSSTLSLPTATVETPVYYYLDLSVNVIGQKKEEAEIKDWLSQVFQNRLPSCVSLSQTGTTPSPFDSKSTTSTAATTLTSDSGTASGATALTTAPAETPTTTAGGTGAFTSTASSTDSIRVTPATPVDEATEIPTTKMNSDPTIKARVARQIGDIMPEISGLNETDIFRGIEVDCEKKTDIRNTRCTVVLQLRQSVPTCCMLRALCAASKAPSNIQAVGQKADRTSKLTGACNGTTEEETGCVYAGPVGASCEESGAAYVGQNNVTACPEWKTCNCSAYCNRPDAYYTFDMSVLDPGMEFSQVLSLVSTLKEPTCSPSANVSCPLSIIASEYKDADVVCGSTGTNLGSCGVVLKFTRSVPICNVSAAVTNALQPDNRVVFNGLVTRVAICGPVDGNPITYTWHSGVSIPASVCGETDEFRCQKGKNVAVKLEERCDQRSLATAGPNVTSTPLNATAEPFNATTAEGNMTTTDGNATVTGTLNTTQSAPNGTVSVNTTSAESAEGQANALLELTGDVSKLSSSQVDQLVSQLEGLLSGPTVSLALGAIVIRIVSNLLDASPETLADSSERIVGLVDTVGLKLVLEERAESLLSPAVALSVKPADGTSFQETVFSISDPGNVQVRADPGLARRWRADSSNPQGSIRLPPSLAQNLTSEEQQEVSRVQFNFYQKSTVFQDKSLGQRKLNSGILGASVGNLSISGLKDEVVIHLRNTGPIPEDYVATCVFWDVTFNDGSGGWSGNGCSVRQSTDDVTICGCNHLTSFAILLDLSREPVVDPVQSTILTFITYIGCGVSAIFLSVTLLTYLAFGKLRKDIPSKILIQLCLALLLLNLVFLVDAWLALYPDAVGLCISTAWFLHYFLLVSFTWMGLEAVHMYLALVKVFNSYISRYMVKFSLVGWGVPMIVVIIVIAIDEDNYGLVSYGKYADGTSDQFCWLKNDIAFYVAVVAYFGVIFLFNLVMFVVVLVQLCRIKRQNPHNAQHRSTLQDARSVVGITILLGLTWGFAFFAWGPVNLAFMYLFAIFNSLQGFFIFLFHCAVKENVRRQWRVYLCCGRMRLAENSEWSRTATQKNVKKSSVTRLTSLHSSESLQSNNLSSSNSFLVNDSSEHIHGTGSPLEDRTITADEDPSTDVVLNEINSQYRTQQAS